MTGYLFSLSSYELACIFTAWLLLAIGAGVGIGRGAKAADKAASESDADWIPGWMSGADLISDDEVFPTADAAEQAVFDKLCAEIDRNFRVMGESA